MKKCIHYYICLNSFETLCNDSKCNINKEIIKRDDKVRLELVRQAIDNYKREHGIKSFLKIK